MDNRRNRRPAANCLALSAGVTRGAWLAEGFAAPNPAKSADRAGWGRAPCNSAGSAFDAAHGQTGGHAAAEHVVDHDRRDRVDDRGRHHVVPWRLVAVEK